MCLLCYASYDPLCASCAMYLIRTYEVEKPEYFTCGEQDTEK